MINTINNKVFRNANEAYEYVHDQILQHGVTFGDTKALFNVGFYITDPKDRKIVNRERGWSEEYAEAEWQWYLSGDNSIHKLGEIYGKVPEIWKRMADGFGYVNSNYGWQWKRNNQLSYVVSMLKANPDTRQATISIYDGKEIDNYKHDTSSIYLQFHHKKLDYQSHSSSSSFSPQKGFIGITRFTKHAQSFALISTSPSTLYATSLSEAVSNHQTHPNDHQCPPTQ